jgi:hypothetical protein
MCSTVEKVMAAQGGVGAATPSGTGTASRACTFRRSCAKPSTWKPSTPDTFSQRLSRPSRQARQRPQVSAP